MNRTAPTGKQLYTLAKLIPEVEPKMVLPLNMTRTQAMNRIAYLLKKQKDPRMAKKYMQ